VSELRGALPVAINVFDIQWYYALPIAFIGNLLPIPFVYFLIERIRRLFNKLGILGVWTEKFLARTRRRADFIQKYGKLGLAVFVAIPLPITGAWTGIIAAYLIGMRFRDTVAPICMGVLISGIIVTVFCLLEWTGAIIAGVALCVLLILWLRPRRKKETAVNE
ncbi:MAG: small multi-drug export protein, partial [Chloroflexota bacterium]|nr:small multi-drug export protein [Chloroflexota bacterium]